MKTLLLCPLLLGALLALPAAPAPQEPSLLLVGRLWTDSIGIPIEWIAYDGIAELEPEVLPDGRIRRRFALARRDTVVLKQADLNQILKNLTPAPNGWRASLPRDGLLVRWVPGVEILEVLSAADLGAIGQSDTVLSTREVHYPKESGLRRSEHGPAEKWTAACRYDPQDPFPAVRTRAALGLLGVYPQRAVFAARGEIDDGPDGSPAWLNVAVDAAGDYWLWFSAD